MEGKISGGDGEIYGKKKGELCSPFRCKTLTMCDVFLSFVI
jgi:hypothetical protein